MKIHIIGGPGSGKSTLAEELSQRYGIPHHDLDELQWDAAAESYGKKREAAERDDLLNQILKQDDWIVEGVYYAWCAQCFADADAIFLLNVPRAVYRCRIIRRFFRRKLGMEKGKKETLKDLRALLRWADKYRKENMIEIRDVLAPYADKLVEINGPSVVGKKIFQKENSNENHRHDRRGRNGGGAFEVRARRGRGKARRL